MSVADAALRQLDPDTPEQILRRLGKLAGNASPAAMRDLPRASLFLAGGHTVSGRVVRFEPAEPARSRDTILLHIDEAPSDFEVCYVPLEQIIAVGLRLSEADLQAFSSSRNRIPTSQPPTRLGLQREARDAASRWSALVHHALTLEVDWTAWPDDESEFFALADTLTDLDRFMRAWAADDDARQAIGKAFGDVAICLGDQSAATIAEGRLTIMIGRRANQLAPLDAAALRAAVERQI
jgi:hypothetical protein